MKKYNFIAKLGFPRAFLFFPKFFILALTGCSIEKKSPDFLILNSYFPSWLVGGLIAIPITILARCILIKLGVDDFLPWRFFVYIGFWIIVTMVFFYINSPR
jgi:hypothetical protein